MVLVNKVKKIKNIFLKSSFLLITTLFLCACVSRYNNEKPALDIDASTLSDYWYPQQNTIVFNNESLNAPKRDGMVTLSYSINNEGEVTDIVVVKSLPVGLWDEFAIKAAKNLRYRPSTSNPSKQAVRLQTSFEFSAAQ
jgi:TonB family protein